MEKYNIKLLMQKLDNYCIINCAYYKKSNETELFLKVLLNKYIYTSNKEFYNCSLEKIIEAIGKFIKIEKKCFKCNEININNINISNELLNKYKYNYYKLLLI